MNIIFKKSFVKSYKALSKTDKLRADSAIALFQENPTHADLRNHALRGKLKGFRAISTGFDLRIVFKEHENHTLVIFVKVGTHSQIY